MTKKLHFHIEKLNFGWIRTDIFSWTGADWYRKKKLGPLGLVVGIGTWSPPLIHSPNQSTAADPARFDGFLVQVAVRVEST